MPYHVDHFEHRYVESHRDRVLTAEQMEVIDRRARLLWELVQEIETGGDSILRLYAGLLAKELCKSDELLMKRCGERVAKLTHPRVPKAA